MLDRIAMPGSFQRAFFPLLERTWRWRRPLAWIALAAGAALVGAAGWADPVRIGVLGLALVLGWIGVARLARNLSRTAARKQARILSRSRVNRAADFTSWDRLPVEPATRDAVEARRRQDRNAEIVLGRYDHDGRVLAEFGPLPYLPLIDESEFVPRPRLSVDLVLIGDRVLIRKGFQDDAASFIREWRNLALLRGRANVPSLYQVDERPRRLYKNFIPGRTVRSVLVEAGAKILSIQTRPDPTLADLDEQERIVAVLARGTRLLSRCVSDQFLGQLEQQIERVHACGVVGLSLTFGNVLIEDGSGAPWLLDFDGARASSGWVYGYRRARDVRMFQRIYKVRPN